MGRGMIAICRVLRMLRAACVRIGHGRGCVRFVVVKREKPLEKKQGQEPNCRPMNGRRRSDPHRLGQHVKKGRPKHRSCRKAQVHLKPRVVEDRRQRQKSPEDADRHDR